MLKKNLSSLSDNIYISGNVLFIPKKKMNHILLEFPDTLHTFSVNKTNPKLIPVHL